jgi:RND family efflux transporter MFP subunit
MKMKTTKVPFMTFALALVALVSTGCGGGDHQTAPAEDRAPVSVEIGEAAMVELPRITETTGSVQAWSRVSPGTKIMGRIERVPVREGDRVRRGQVLAELEKRDLEAAVEQAKAAVIMAETNLENASAQYRRMSDLHERGSVTDKNYEDASARYHVTTAAVQQAKANLTAAEVTLAYAQIRSPVDGWVIARMAEPGNMTAPGQPLFTVEELSRVKVIAEVPETDVVGVEEGSPVTVDVEVLGETWETEVDRVIPSGDPMSRTYQVQVVLPNPDGRLKAGMFARATFPAGTREAVGVPAGAVVRRGQLEGLFVVDTDSRARLRWVRLGREAGGIVEVISGLQPGERFVVDPPAGLSDDAPVTVR